MDVVFILEHEFAGKGSKAVQGPWNLFFFHFFEEVEVSCDSVAEAHAWGCVEFGYAAEDHEVGEFFCESYSGDFVDFRGKFYIGFVDHYEDVLFCAEGEEFSQIFSGDGRRSWIVWVADDQEVVFSLQSVAEVVYIEEKVIFFTEMVVFLGAAGEGEFSGVFGVGWSEDQGVFRVALLDQKGDEFAGAISGENEFGRDITVF